MSDNNEIKNTEIKVSVIIPVFNASKHLSKTLDSISNQTLKELEIICIDDGSTDNSLEILKDYAIKATEYLAKVLDVVLYGSDGASDLSLNDVSLSTDGGEESVITGLVSDSGAVNSNTTLYIVLGVLGAIVIVFAITLAVSRKARYKVSRFFSETFAGLFGKKQAK